MAGERVLVVDDEEQVCKFLGEILKRNGFHVQIAYNGLEALNLAKNNGFSVAVVDLKMPGLSGIETIHRLKEIDPDMEIIVFTGFPSLESSLEAIHHHVFDYLTKPAKRETLERTVGRAAERRRLVIENRELTRQLKMERDRLKEEVIAAKKGIERGLENSKSFLGKSEAMRKVRHFVAQVASSDLTVLILGESGTGKDALTRLIHEASGRDPNVFVKISCPAIPETLLESELFGHEIGAFTGADTKKPGRFELASGGTIFLDEIGDLPLNLQAKLLQVIEHKSFTRLGGRETTIVDVRIIAATNSHMRELIKKGLFRADLFYRLNEYSITLPPLRERRDDIPLLAEYFCALYGKKHNQPLLKISPETMSRLTRQRWSGNVRELETVIQRFAVDGEESSILQSLNTPSPAEPASLSVSDVVNKAEVDAILAALDKTKWNRTKAAKLLGMSYSSIIRRIAKYGLRDR